MIKPCSISNLRTCGALLARSFKFGTVSRSSGRNVLARGDGRSSIANLEQFITSFCAFVIPSGYRGLASVLQNSPSAMPDVLQISTPALVSFQSAAVVLKRSWRALQCPTKVLKDLTK